MAQFRNVAHIVGWLLVAASAPRPALADTPPAPAASAARSAPLTADEAVRIGLARNPQVAAGAAGVASAAASYRSLAAFPPLNLGVSHVTGNSTAPSLTGATTDTIVDLGETLDTSGQRRFQAAGARAGMAAARYQLDETRLTLAQQIRDAYWSLAAARALAQISVLNQGDVETVNRLTHTQEQAGAAPRVDVVRSGIDLASAAQATVAAQGAERSALVALNVLLALPPDAPVDLADSLAQAPAVPAVLGPLPPLAELQRTALATRPLVQAAREQVRVQEYAVKQARAARLPDVSVDYEQSVHQNANSWVLGVQLPLLDFGSLREGVRSADQARKQALAQQAQAEQQVLQQVAQAYTDVTQAQTLAASYQADVLTPSATLLAMAQLGYKQGATGILPVIDAETTLRNARTGYVNALLALYKARDEIEAAVGRLPGAPGGASTSLPAPNEPRTAEAGRPQPSGEPR